MPQLPMRAAEISIQALQKNVQTLRAHTGKRVIVVVKANAYGHGASLIAPAAIAAGAEMVAVANITEAVDLRMQGFAAPILCWLLHDGDDFRQAITHDIDLGVSRLRQLDDICDLARELGRRASVHLKLDTGLSRNGATPIHWNALFETAAAAERAGVIRVRSIFSHLANAGEEADRAQASRYDAALRIAKRHGLSPRLEHIAASAAALTHPWLGYNTIRIGLAAYGLNPLDDHASLALRLHPVLRLSAEIIGISHSTTGIAVHGTPERALTLAHLPLGYADGLPRALTGSGHRGPMVRIGEILAPMVGPIGMDECAIDITGHTSQIQIGDRAVLFGDPARAEPSVDTWADVTQTINYEVIARLGPRVNRIAMQDEPAR